jgi:hypothetical protein
VASTGDQLVTAGANLDRGGAAAWVSAGNVTASDNSYATSNDIPAGGTDYLVCTAADLSAVPDGATILGVTVKAEAAESEGTSYTLRAQLQDADGALAGSTKDNTVSGATDVVYTFGGAADLWGATLTAAIVKDVDFGVRLWAVAGSGTDPRVDAVEIAIEYEEATNTSPLTRSKLTHSPLVHSRLIG